MADDMEPCGSLATCAFFNRRMANMPVVSDALKSRFCRGDWTGCARHLLIDLDIAVPEDLYPDDMVRARRIIQDAGEPCPTEGNR